MSSQIHRLAAKGFAENHVVQLAADLKLWHSSKEGLPESCLFHELARICIGYASEGDEYQEAEVLVVLKSLEAVAQLDPLKLQLQAQKSLLERLFPHVRGCDTALWDEYRNTIAPPGAS